MLGAKACSDWPSETFFSLSGTFVMFKDLQREMHLSIVTRVLSCPFSDNMVITIVYIVLLLKSQSVIKDGY